ncbi:hypothetical protein [Ruminococcus sp.]|uniref:hypothetical protein n=1 Tax=Ruminococcus sp. TaxID=41978 RepID=UPI0025EE562F|nr:hypothetical protein [Ruminococcus sp.]
MSILQNGILNDYNVKIILLDETSITVPDPYGGIGSVDYAYNKGAEITVQLIPQETLSAQIAKAITEKKMYTVCVDKGTVLKKGQVFLRKKDNKTFRITESNIEHETPASANLQFSYAKAEEWELPANMNIIEKAQNA